MRVLCADDKCGGTGGADKICIDGWLDGGGGAACEGGAGIVRFVVAVVVEAVSEAVTVTGWVVCVGTAGAVRGGTEGAPVVCVGLGRGPPSMEECERDALSMP